MLKISLLLLCVAFCTSPCAQEENVARYIKCSAADSLLPVKETVKSQLIKEINGKKKQSYSNRLRLVLKSSDKENNEMAGRWLAARQKKDLYQVNLAALVSKYIGETEKNLEKLFNKAEELHCILLFDEADALFGKRDEPGGAGGNDTNAGLVYFLKRVDGYKETILIACTGDHCRTILGKHKFTGIDGSAITGVQ